ncbi:MAG: TIGR03747 family integrating conjugative element membrane protein, partial [Chromatiaceae bacterium]|nr:TIGR03747 family integrating conjugative element membrane protein [Chromatiaceae bacterium]
WFADNSYHYLFEVTRFVDFIQWVSLPPRKYEQGVRATLHMVYKPLAEYVLAMMQVTQVFSVRLAILTLAMPIFLLFSLVALVDGLVQRDLRRWGGGRESSFVYHYAKKAALPLVVLTWVTYLALPFSLHPTFVILPFATLFALTVAVTASTFKKYL